MMKVIPLFMTSGLCVAGNAGMLVPLLIKSMANNPKSDVWADSI